MEKMLFEDSLTVADIPAYWSELYHKYMGIKVPDDNRGCLQDVHWSHGSFGYFPTYTLGSLYAAQFFNLFTKADSDWEEETIAGQFGPLKEWLNSNIHQYGRQYTSSELCNKLTGKSLELSAFRSYLETKH
jgi:carboxypeptidase Taq